MNRRNFLKSLPFIGALATAIFWCESPHDTAEALYKMIRLSDGEIVKIYDLNEYAKRMGINTLDFYKDYKSALHIDSQGKL